MSAATPSNDVTQQDAAPAVAGYRQRCARMTSSEVLAHEAALEDAPMGIDAFIKDVYEYALVMDVLESLGRLRRWPRALELGGAEGTIARLLRGHGYAQQTTVVEIKDYARQLSTARFWALWWKFRLATTASGVWPRLREFLLGESTLGGKRLSPLFASFGYRPPSGSRFWKSRLRYPPVIDRYVVGQVYDLTEPVDLVTAFLCLPYFDVEALFRKLSTLLTEGGLFVALTDYWWYPVNSTFIATDVPYSCQRMSPEEFQRFVRSRYPEEADDILHRYAYFHVGQHPTIQEYVAAADRHDLSVVGVRSLIPPHDTDDRAGLTPRFLNQFEDTRLTRVLDDIHCVRPDVGLTDVLTRYVVLIFEKRARMPGTLADYVRALHDPAVL